MVRLRITGVVLLAVFASAMAITASASALILPLVEPKQATWTGAGTTPELLGSAPITCTAVTGKGTEGASGTSSLGALTLTFTGCKETKLNLGCETSGDAKETILIKGTWHLVYDKLSAKEGDTEANLGVAILILVASAFKCTALATVEIKGSVLCLVLEYKVSNITHTFHCIAEKTKATEKEYFNAEDKEGSVGKAELLCKINKGAFEECAELALGTITYPKAVKIDG